MDGWKSGGGLKFEGKRIVRDLWSDKLQICFEYDGIWHFEDILGQLEDKKIKDNLLEKWCIYNNYRLIRIDELEFINEQQIENLIYENKEPIIKIGKRYKGIPNGIANVKDIEDGGSSPPCSTEIINK